MRKEQKESKKEITIIGIVREIEDRGKSYSVGIASGNDMYAVQLNESGIDLQYEVGNTVEASGVLSRTKNGLCRITVSGYEVYEMDEDDLDDFGSDPDYYFRK